MVKMMRQDWIKSFYGFSLRGMTPLFLPLMIILQNCSSPETDQGAGSDLDSLSKKGIGEKNSGTQKAKPVNGTVEPTPQTIRDELPGKKSYSSVEKRKKAFFEYLYPIVHSENERILNEKAYVERAQRSLTRRDTLPDSSITRLKALGVKYRVKPEKLPSKEGVEELLKKVDIIPEGLALIQAANESNWGRSRFAKQGNNLFGQWCFSKGCGIVPKRRSEGSGHEVAAFPNVQFSVRSYLRNLNSHPAYKQLRDQRAQMRQKGKEPTAHALAGGLTNYAGIGHEYVKILRQMIETNKKLLEKADPVPPVLSETVKEQVFKRNSS